MDLRLAFWKFSLPGLLDELFVQTPSQVACPWTWELVAPQVKLWTRRFLLSYSLVRSPGLCQRETPHILGVLASRNVPQAVLSVQGTFAR